MARSNRTSNQVVYLLLLTISLLFTGCSKSTTYKAPMLGYNLVIHAKTVSLSTVDCKDHLGYYSSVQNTMWGGWDNNIRWYDSVELTCLDGYIVHYTIQQINNHYSPKVAEILSKDTQ